MSVFQLINVLKANQNEMIFGKKSFLFNISRINSNVNNNTSINNTNINNIDTINTFDITTLIMHNFEDLCFKTILILMFCF